MGLDCPIQLVGTDKKWRGGAISNLINKLNCLKFVSFYLYNYDKLFFKVLFNKCRQNYLGTVPAIHKKTHKWTGTKISYLSHPCFCCKKLCFSLKFHNFGIFNSCIYIENSSYLHTFFQLGVIYILFFNLQNSLQNGRI